MQMDRYDATMKDTNLPLPPRIRPRQVVHDPETDPHDRLDSLFRAQMGRLTGGLSPMALAAVWADWSANLAGSPGKLMELGGLATRQTLDYAAYLARAAGRTEAPDDVIAPEPGDRRFRHPGWRKQPFHAMQQAFLLNEAWWDAATTGVRGMSRGHAHAANFAARQMLDAVAPSNFAPANPEVLEKARETGGVNFIEGARNWAEDQARIVGGKRPAILDDYVVGKDVAATPGRVVYRNHLIELIQYAPTTGRVHAEPVLIVPAWIMKYYILDLSPHNSMVKYLVSQGFTVFMVSWRNPGAEDAGLGMDAYHRMGPMAALDAVQEITGRDRVHGVGYCLGGTLLGITAAAMARDGDPRLASLTLFAAQFDFRDAGELLLFISDAEVAFLEDVMWREGYLDAQQMAGAFQLLRSNDLVWSKMQHEYMMGERARPNDIMAWNADATRMPYRMHAEYLRKLFLNNAFASNEYCVDGVPVTPRDIDLPIFALGTETDHVAPWNSVYKVTALTRSEVTFVLTNGGHNAGVLSEPGHKRRHYRVRVSSPRDHHVPAAAWSELADLREGSWWPEWTAWLADLAGEGVDPPPLADGYGPAPGTYVCMA